MKKMSVVNIREQAAKRLKSTKNKSEVFILNSSEFLLLR